MIFQAREHLQRLQTVNPKLFEKIILGCKRASGQLKMLRRQVQHFLRSLFERAHVSLNLSFSLKEEKLVLRLTSVSLRSAPVDSQTRRRHAHVGARQFPHPASL